MKRRAKNFAGSFFGIKLNIIVVILLCAVCIAGTAMVSIKHNESLPDNDANMPGAQKFLEIKGIIDKNFVGTAEDDSIYNAAYAAMVRALGDQWSYYMTKDEYQAYQLYSANQYEGIGVTIGTDGSKGFSIVSVAAGTPAESAGLMAGDVILGVGGVSVEGMTTNDVSTLIKSHMGQKLTITVKAETDGKTKDVEVDCTAIYSNPVSYDMQDRRVGYIKINNFEQGAADESISAIESLLSEGATAIIFDVRNNPGGLLDELTKLLDYLLPEGEIFVSLNESGEETIVKSDNVCLQMPMAVLINSSTFSAAEYFAATMEEYGWATTVGEPTTGKGRSQITIELADGSAVHISNNSYLTPNRVDLSLAGGIVPEQVVEQKEKGDVQLDAAVTAMITAVKSGA